MKAIDFSVPRRMSKSALVILFFKALSSFASYIFLIGIIKLFNSEEGFSVLRAMVMFLIMIGACVGVAFVCALVGYYSKKFYVEDGNLIIMHRFIHRETTSIPLYKIQSMRTKRGVLYRLLDMTGVSFDTLASKVAEVELILDDSDWEALLNQVKIQERNLVEQERKEQAPLVEEHVRQAANEDEQKLSFSNFNLIKGAFCQNHLRGMAVLGAILVAFYGKVSSVGDKALSYAVDYAEAHADLFSFSLSFWVVLVALLYLLVMLLWIGKVCLRYFNLEVRMTKQQLFFESGLLTRFSSRFSHDKVCTVYVKQNILEKWLGGATILLKQAFNATDKDNESYVKIYGSGSAALFLNWWLGKDYASSKDITMAQSGRGLMGYVIRKEMLILLAIGFTLCYFEWYVWLIALAALLPIVLAKGILAVHRSCILLKDDYLVINTGKFADIHNYLKYSDMEVVRLVRTPFTPFFHRVHLTISTNGTLFVVRCLKEQEAGDIYELLLCKCQEKG